MKKKIYLLLLPLLLVGCEVDGSEENSKMISPMDEIYTVEFEGHKYVIYEGYDKGGIVHAESCPCKETKKEESK